jgi:hypothetical protein
MILEQRIELLHRSSQRMMEALKQPKDKAWLKFLRRESWVHLKRAFQVWWEMINR